MLEGSASEEHQENELELLEGATVKPDWQVGALIAPCMYGATQSRKCSTLYSANRWYMPVNTCMAQHTQCQ